MRHLIFVVAAVVSALGLPLPAAARRQPLGPIWTGQGVTVAVTPCPAGGDTDATCRAVEVRRGEATVLLGSGYTKVRVLWCRTLGAAGPDLLIRADHGGSGGSGDLFAVTPADPIAVRRLGGERIDGVEVDDPHGRFAFDLPFGIGFFNGASHAQETDVLLPIVWAGGDFALDLPALTARGVTREDLASRRLAIASELADWANDDDAAHDRLAMPRTAKGTPVVVQALADLMLSGHADLARDLLRRTWPQSRVDYRRPMDGEAAFWSDLCRAIVANQQWSRFGLARLPHADQIIAGAGGG